jgi:membrane protein implicated in regulation of membrane protease activity
MSEWLLLIVLVLVLIAILWYRYLRTRGAADGSPFDDQTILRDFEQERNTQRSGRMSAEDQLWETEARQRDRDTREGTTSDREP